MGKFYASSITFDNEENLYLSGNYFAFEVNVLRIQKIDSGGTSIWNKTIMSDLEMYYNKNNYTVFDEYSNTIVSVGNYTNDIDTFFYETFIHQHDLNGNILWKKDRINNLFGKSISTNEYGDIYITGYYKDSVNISFDTAVNHYLVSNNASTDIFIQKIDMYGNTIWGKSIGGSAFDMGKKITIDDDNNIYTVGLFSNTLIADNLNVISNGLLDVYILKLDIDGNVIDLYSFGGSDNDNIFGLEMNDNNIYVSGLFKDTINFGLKNNTHNLISKTDYNVYLVKYNYNGEYIWGNSTNNKPITYPYNFYYDFTIDNQSNIYSSSFFTDSLTIDTFALKSTGMDDIYIQKIIQNTTVGINDKSIQKVELVIYPNPINNKEINIVKPINCELFKISINDVNGKKQFTNLFEDDNVLNVSFLSSGLYFITVENIKEHTILRKKIIIR